MLKAATRRVRMIMAARIARIVDKVIRIGSRGNRSLD